MDMCSFIPITFFVITSHELFLYIAPGFIIVVMFIIRPPVIEKIIETLNLSQEEITQLK